LIIGQSTVNRHRILNVKTTELQAVAVSNSGVGFNSDRGRERSDPFYGSGFKRPVLLCELSVSAVFEPIEAIEMRFSAVVRTVNWKQD